MNHRKTCLLEMYGFFLERGPNKYVPEESLKCFEQGNVDYLGALNLLLDEGLILSVRGPDQRVVLRVNPEKIEIIRKELYPWYHDFRLWVVSVIGAIVVIFAILKFLMK